MLTTPPEDSERAGRLFVVSGPGGVGKGTVIACLRKRLPHLAVSVSVTTRAPRPGEIDGRHYHFLPEERFDALLKDDAFLEWAEFGGRRYGTLWSSVHDVLDSGRRIVLEIDVQGALQVRRRIPGAVLVFLAPPDDDALLERLRTRGTDSAERINERMRIARWELEQASAFDHVVVNDDLEAATERIARILNGTPAE